MLNEKGLIAFLECVPINVLISTFFYNKRVLRCFPCSVLSSAPPHFSILIPLNAANRPFLAESNLYKQ